MSEDIEQPSGATDEQTITTKAFDTLAAVLGLNVEQTIELVCKLSAAGLFVVDAHFYINTLEQRKYLLGAVELLRKSIPDAYDNAVEIANRLVDMETTMRRINLDCAHMSEETDIEH